MSEQEATEILDTADFWALLSPEERAGYFLGLEQEDAEELFLTLSADDQCDLVQTLPSSERRWWVRSLAPDDAADFIQLMPLEARDYYIGLLDKVTRKEVNALLAYAEDEAGGLMSPRYVRLRAEMTVDEAISYVRRQARRSIETISYAYVLDEAQILLGIVSLRDLLIKGATEIVRDVMTTDVVTVAEDEKQEEVARLLADHDLMAIPVVTPDRRLVGIITVDDVIDVVQQELTEDIQRIGGSEALDSPYLQSGFIEMVRKRAGWLSILFVGETLTATAMAHYEEQIARAVVLALFIPLIISSGGNSGSQASTLVIRALALGEVRTRQWLKVLGRELVMGLTLGTILGVLGLLRVLYWPQSLQIYGEHYVRIGFTVSLSLVGVVLWGTVTGSMLPLILRRLGFDPASASAPFVATLVDVTGLVIYFSVANVLLGGLLL